MASYTGKLAGVGAMVALAVTGKLAGVGAVEFAARAHLVGVGAVQLVVGSALVGIGKLAGARTGKVVGVGALTPFTVQGALVGVGGIQFVARGQIAGVGAMVGARTAQLAGVIRIADDSLARYELYRGVDAQPDFTAAAWQTFTGASFLSPVLTAGHTYHFVLRRRNAFDLESHNVSAWAVVVDGGGAVIAPPPRDAAGVQLFALAGLQVKIIAAYDQLADGINVADEWRIYSRTNGTNPDPAIDTPTTVAMKFRNGQAKLQHTFTGLTAATTFKAILRTARSGDDVESVSTTVHAAVVLA